MDLGLGSLIGGAIGGIGSLFGSALGSNASKKAVAEQNAGNMALAEYAYQKDLEMWNRQNVYNDPSAQMQRLKDAGLNPNLMYGQGTTGNATSSPDYNAPTLGSYTGFGDFGASQAGQQLQQGLNGFIQARKTEAETNYIRQNTQNLQTTNELTELKIIQQGYANAITKNERDFWYDLFQAKKANLESGTILNEARTDFTNTETYKNESLIPLYVNKMQAEISNLLYDNLHLKPAQVRNLMQNVELNKAMERVADARIEVMQQELQFGEARLPYAKNSAYLDNQIKQLEMKIKRILSEEGFNVSGSVWNNVGNILLKGLYDMTH